MEPTIKLVRLAQIAAGVGERYYGASVDDFDSLDLPPSPLGGIYIHGNNNVGKTHLACALVGHYRVCLGMPAFYLTAYKAVDRVHHSDIVDEDYMFSVDLLVVDDITALHRSKSGYEMRCLAQLLDARFQSNKSTIVTSNAPLEHWCSDGGNGIIWRCLSGMHQIELKERQGEQHAS